MEKWYGKSYVSRTLRLDEGMSEKIRVAALDSNQSQNAWIVQALRRALKNWELSDEFMARGKERGRGHKRESIGGGVQLFDPMHCHESGWPHRYTENYRAEVGYALQDGPEELRDRMQNAWNMWGIEGEYTDAHLQETMRWYRAQKRGRVAK